MTSTETQPKTCRGRVGICTRLPRRIVIGLIRLYQLTISPWLGPRCRFHPTCSNYCIEAIRQHGMVPGLWLGIKRIGKCHPFHPGGVDPVPEPEQNHLIRETHGDGGGASTEREMDDSRKVEKPVLKEKRYE